MKRATITFIAAAAILLPTLASAQTVNRPVSQFFRWNATESSTTGTKIIYSHSFFNPLLSGSPRYNVAYLDVALTGDAFGTLGQTRVGLACLLDGSKLCPPGGATFADGAFVALHVSDGAGSEDHDMTYHWCVPLTSAGTHTLSLFLNSSSGLLVFVEGGFVNIELAKLPSANACTAAPNL
jgi:hypothetical protein